MKETTKLKTTHGLGEDISDKRLVSKIHIECFKFNIQTLGIPVKKWTEDMNRHFSKEDIQMVNRHVKRCSTLLIIRKIQIKPQ